MSLLWILGGILLSKIKQLTVLTVLDKNKVTVYRPIIKESVEEKILMLQNEKKQLFEDLLGQAEGEFFSGKLSKEDFEFILDTKID